MKEMGNLCRIGVFMVAIFALVLTEDPPGKPCKSPCIPSKECPHATMEAVGSASNGMCPPKEKGQPKLVCCLPKRKCKGQCHTGSCPGNHTEFPGNVDATSCPLDDQVCCIQTCKTPCVSEGQCPEDTDQTPGNSTNNMCYENKEFKHNLFCCVPKKPTCLTHGYEPERYTCHMGSCPKSKPPSYIEYPGDNDASRCPIKGQVCCWRMYEPRKVTID